MADFKDNYNFPKFQEWGSNIFQGGGGGGGGGGGSNFFQMETNC